MWLLDEKPRESDPVRFIRRHGLVSGNIQTDVAKSPPRAVFSRPAKVSVFRARQAMPNLPPQYLAVFDTPKFFLLN